MFLADSMESVRVMFRRWAKRVADATKKGQEYAGDMWQHCKVFLPFDQSKFYHIFILAIYSDKHLDIDDLYRTLLGHHFITMIN